VDYLCFNPTVFCAQLYALHRIQWDYFSFIPLYSLQSIQLCTDYSGIIDKEENRISTDVRAATDEESRTQIIHQTAKEIALAPCDSL
jgi:hypothetical protein